MPEHYFECDSLPQLQLPAADPQAEALNRQLIGRARPIYDLLSPCGKSLYYPKQGLLLQGEEAAASRYNGTVGIALDNASQPMHYGSISEKLKLDPCQCVPYASSYGLLPLRQLWRDQLLQKNPTLQQSLANNKQFSLSLPVVTGGITHGLWIAFQMLLGRGEELLLPHLFWPNYRLIAQVNCGARLKHYNTFRGERLDLEAIERELQAPGQKKVLLFNFPQNPTGYSPHKSEMARLQQLFLQAAESGKRLAIICDDAYWGLCYDEETERQSLFAFIAGLHPNILAVKLDGATKEDFAWGLRVGFITFGLQVADRAQSTENVESSAGLSKVLEEKAGAAVRLSTSNCSRLSQQLLLETYTAPATSREREQLKQVLAARYRTVRRCLDSAEAQQSWPQMLQPLPFNSGYFMTFEIQHPQLGADELRKYLLSRYDIGLIALQGKYLRFAFSAVAEKDIPFVLQTLHQAYGELLAQKG